MINNKLIAEFMGKAPEAHYDNLATAYKNMKYNSSWDWLMLVIDKIESLEIVDIFEISSCNFSHRVEISPTYKNSFGLISIRSTESKLHTTYSAVIEFIKWYNKDK